MQFELMMIAGYAGILILSCAALYLLRLTYPKTFPSFTMTRGMKTMNEKEYKNWFLCGGIMVLWIVWLSFMAWLIVSYGG